MSAETHTNYFTHWQLSDYEGLENVLPASQGVIQGELDQETPLAEAFPMVTNGELDPWIMDHFSWDGELASKPETSSQPYLHIWDGSFYGHPQHESIPACDYQEATTLLQFPAAHEAHRTPSQLATKRALFIAPPAHAFTLSEFTKSPISEPCGTPETSQTSSMSWETDPESEEMRISRSPVSTMIEQPSFDFFPVRIDRDNSLTPLEMPDGSLRMSSNWLPVDTTAGFTIGSHTASDKHASKNHMHMEALDDIRDGFISSNSASWKFDR